MHRPSLTWPAESPTVSYVQIRARSYQFHVPRHTRFFDSICPVFQTFILPTCMEGRMTSNLLFIQNFIFGLTKGLSLDVSFDSVLIHQTLRRHLYDKGKLNIKSVRARYQDCFLGGRDFFPPRRLFCSERLPLYIFLSFTSLHKTSQRERHQSENH